VLQLGVCAPFPRTELITARQKPYGHASRMRYYPQHIIVDVETGSDGGSFLYHFTPELQPKYVFPSGNHEFRHRDLELAGRIDHPWLSCPELDKPLTLNIWDPARGWRDEPIRWRDNPWKDGRTSEESVTPLDWAQVPESCTLHQEHSLPSR